MSRAFEQRCRDILSEAPSLPPPEVEAPPIGPDYRIKRTNQQRDVPDQLEVVPLDDPVVERFGFPPLHPYIETVWLGCLGPTATLLYRRMGMWAITNPDGLEVDATDLSVSMGLGEGLAKNSMLGKAIGRLANFGAAQWRGETLAVRRALGTLPAALTKKLSLSAYQAHTAMVEERFGRAG